MKTTDEKVESKLSFYASLGKHLRASILKLIEKYEANLEDVNEVLEYEPEDLEAIAQIEVLEGILIDLKTLRDE